MLIVTPCAPLVAVRDSHPCASSNSQSAATPSARAILIAESTRGDPTPENRLEIIRLLTDAARAKSVCFHRLSLNKRLIFSTVDMPGSDDDEEWAAAPALDAATVIMTMRLPGKRPSSLGWELVGNGKGRAALTAYSRRLSFCAFRRVFDFRRLVASMPHPPKRVTPHRCCDLPVSSQRLRPEALVRLSSRIRGRSPRREATFQQSKQIRETDMRVPPTTSPIRETSQQFLNDQTLLLAPLA